ncbi:MraY family glycosyltransferase [Mycoplasma sp. P36-A1]|uniref:MraY family glycosyltransferase n=1 Tax=Mycoplasma sp. P36-A1 TaxID=3252900 RepID=UPI003C2F544F
MLSTYVIGFAIALISSLLLVPVVKIVAKELWIVDKPGARRVHTKVTPRLGGLAIYSAFMIGCLFTVKGDRAIMAMLMGGFIIALSGVIDDMVEMSARNKLLFQIVATLVVVFYGQIRIGHINIPGGFVINFGLLSTFITILWIIGITNAVNLIDGLDGLCAGVCTIILSTFAMMAFILGREDIVLISLLLLGSVIGFLYYNFYPASIFMGDTGALFLGFMIATISLLGFKSSAFLTLGPAIFILAIPILDTFLSIIRRRLKGVSFSTPDKEHLHHTLMYKMNLTQLKTVLTIYTITFYFSQVSYIYLINKRVSLAMLIVIAVIIELFVEKTGMISKNYRPILNIINKIKNIFIKDKEN